LRIKEQGTHLTLNEHDDYDDNIILKKLPNLRHDYNHYHFKEVGFLV